jgi:hypothetical protein
MSDRPDLRALLEDAPYIDDAGFTNRVVHALPRRQRVSMVRYAVVPVFTALACVLAFALSGRALSSPGAHFAFSLYVTWSFLAAAFALVLVASATLLAADD